MPRTLTLWQRDRLAAGWLGSAAGALTAVLRWPILSWLLVENLPGMSIAIGALAAVGMALFYRERDFNAGFAAFNVALLTIFTAKLVTFGFFTPPKPSPRLEHIRNVLALADAETALNTQGHRTSDARRPNGPRAEREARAALSAMSPADLERRWDAWRATQPAIGTAIWLTGYAFGAPRDVELAPDPPEVPQSGIVSRFFATMFPPFTLFERFSALVIAFAVPLLGLKRIAWTVLRL